MKQSCLLDGTSLSMIDVTILMMSSEVEVERVAMMTVVVITSSSCCCCWQFVVG